MRSRSLTPVDWVRLKQRLAGTEEALARGHAPSPEQRRAVLEARARALAVEPPDAEAAGASLEVVEFELAQVHYAIAASCVREVQPLKELTDVPCTPAFVSGIINAHGRILAVIDLKRFLELPESGLSDQNKVIILQHGDVELGILADRIIGASRLPLTQLQPPLPVHGAKRVRCLHGITPTQVFVLNAQRLMSDPELVVDEEVSP